MNADRPTEPTDINLLDCEIVSEEVSFSTVPGLLPRIVELVDTGGCVCLDLKNVTRTDSAGLSLLVEWQREAVHKSITIKFQNIPPQLLALARVCGLEDPIPQ